MFTSLLKGIWIALKNPKLVLLLWVWNLLLGYVAYMPARTWFTPLNVSTESERLLTRFNMGTFADLSKSASVSPMSFLVATLLGLGLVALVGSAFVNGGMVETIGNRTDSRTFMHRFFRGGGHFFWRFVRLALVAFITGGIATAIVASAMGAVTAPLTNSEWEPAGMFWGLMTAVVAGLTGLLFMLALDYARIRVARDGGTGMVRTYFRSLGFVAQHIVATYGIALAYLVLVAVVLLAYVAHEAAWTASNWAAIWVLLIVQQALMLARCGLRVMQVGAEWEYFGMSVPVVVAAPPPQAHETVAVQEPVAQPAPEEPAPAAE